LTEKEIKQFYFEAGIPNRGVGVGGLGERV